MVETILKIVVMVCRSLPNYRVMICVSNIRQLEGVYWYIRKIFEFNIDAPRFSMRNSFHDYWITFNNGSTIYIRLGNEMARGHRAHCILVDKGIDDEIFHNAIAPMATFNRICENDEVFFQFNPVVRCDFERFEIRDKER